MKNKQVAVWQKSTVLRPTAAEADQFIYSNVHDAKVQANKSNITKYLNRKIWLTIDSHCSELLSGWGVQRGAGTQQILGTSCAGIVLVVELVESCVDPKCRRALVPHDAGFRHDVHWQRHTLSLVVESPGELIQSEVSGACALARWLF